MKILILGDAANNCGTSNVHKEFLKHWPQCDQIDYVHAQDKAGFVFEGIQKGIRADVVLSPLINFPCICVQDILHWIGKPIVCFNHGYVPYENDMNRLGHSKWWLNRYRAALRSADSVVANSVHQREFVLRFQPELSGRIHSISLGIERFAQRKSKSDAVHSIVAVAGGNRCVKGNDVVSRAVASLVEKGEDVEFRIYGKSYEGCASSFEGLPKGFGTECMRGQVDRETFLKDLNQSNLFVMNSRHDSFGLSLFDSLHEGCSVLVSRQCGALEALKSEDCDVVEDCEDVAEVASKMAYLLRHPNAERLYSTIDFDAYDWDRQVARLRDICVQVKDAKHGRVA